MSKVYCSDCDNVERGSRKLDPWKWLCLKFPRSDYEGFGFVTRGTWDDAPPFHRCVSKNRDGECKKFEPCKELETS